ncbi:MAG: nucleotidyl transferase AbiEii/AbiGii toxin family protein [Chloroflexi bacterium]|nr:nucleotidyl transferase AbiEii/AbiGii toxin family protein [Chloroflexota bacterium]
MDLTAARALAAQQQISIDFIVREEYELLLLKELYESEFGAHLVFKGGTALRLVYGSPRFSEDLDFSAIGELDAEKFAAVLQRSTNKYPAIVGIESRAKFYTLFAGAKIKENFLTRAFQIKIEISKRKGKLVQGEDFTERVITSQHAPLTVLARVATLELMLREKKDALKNRRAARDVFDYWFIHQLLKQEAQVDLTGFDIELAKAELHRLLPRSYWRVVDAWLASAPKTRR